MSKLIKNDNKKLVSFEDFRHDNGMACWWASEFMWMLGYDNLKKFQKVLDRTTASLISLGVKHYEHIILFEREDGGKSFEDFKMTRFACYLAAMNGDPKKKEVALAQAYFVEQTRKFEVYLQGAEDVGRLLYREEVKKGQKSLMGAAKKAGVADYSRFNNQGYLGLYNMGIWQLKEKRNLPPDSKTQIQDYMGRTELAANLFRITQTEEKLKMDDVRWQSDADSTHFNIARRVREIVKENTGKYPEDLPLERRLPEVRKELKRGMKFLAGLDKTKKPTTKKRKLSAK